MLVLVLQQTVSNLKSVVAGAKYKLAEKVYANGGLEYNRLGSFDDTKVNNYGAKVGVGYEF